MSARSDLSHAITRFLRKAPQGWDRSLIITHDHELGTIATGMDVFYSLNEEDPEAPAQVQRVQVKHHLAVDELDRAVNPDGIIFVMLEGMAKDLGEAHQ